MQARTLGHRETLCKLAHEYCSGTGLITFHCRLQGLLDVKVLSTALSQLVKSNPILNLTFKKGDNENFYTLNTNPEQSLKKLPLSVCPSWADDDWKNIFEHENNSPITFYGIYLWRIVLLDNVTGNRRKHDIIASFHHAIFDSRSFIVFIKQWFLIYDSINKQQAPKFRSGLTESLELIISEQVSRNSYLFKQVEYWIRSFWMKKSKLLWEKKVNLQRRRSKNIFIDFPEISKLANLCRQRQVTFGALLTAALLKSIGDYYFQTKRESKCGLKLVTAVDFRNKMKNVDPEELMGMYVSSAYTYHQVFEDSDVWVLAKSYHRELLRGINRCIIPQVFYPNQLLRAFKKQAASMLGYFPGGISVSNMGVVSLGESTLSVTDLKFCSNRQLGDFLINLNALTLNGKLRLACTFVEPLLSENSAKKIVMGAINILEQARDYEANQGSNVE